MNNKKGISPVVAVALLLVVSVVAVVGYQSWYQGYQSVLTTDVEQKSTSSGSIDIEYISSDGTLYVKNTGNSNTTMGSVKIGDTDCSINEDLEPGINKIDITSCLSDTGKNNVVIVTDSGIIEESVYVKEVTSTPSLGIYNLLHVLDNPNNYSTSANDQFGYSVGISGNNAIIGTYFEDDAGGSESGKAYIFDVTSGNLLHVLDNPNNYSTSVNDYFGSEVSISGNNAVVGAFGEDDVGGIQSGKAYIFDVTSGNLLHVLDNPNNYSTSVNDYFGYSVSIDGNFVIVGTGSEDDAGGTQSGKAYIFNVTSGNLLHVLDNPNNYSTSAGDNFGDSVSISGNTAVVGAFGEDDAGGSESGKAYIFDVISGNLLHVLDNPNAYDTSVNDKFGYSVSISGNNAVIGTYYEDDVGGSDSGKAYIFDVTTGNLLHTLDNPNAYGTSLIDRFGKSVSISGNNAVVGAWAEGDAGGTQSGKAYIFDVTTGNLVQVLDNPNNYSTSFGDYFGYRVSVSGNNFLIGANFENDAGGSDSGKAYIFN